MCRVAASFGSFIQLRYYAVSCLHHACMAALFDSGSELRCSAGSFQQVPSRCVIRRCCSAVSCCFIIRLSFLIVRFSDVMCHLAEKCTKEGGSQPRAIMALSCSITPFCSCAACSLCFLALPPAVWLVCIGRDTL